jgi:small-conductance mechanosensitive channel
MRARTVFIILLVLILVFALWPTALSMGAAGIAQLFGCETDFNRAIPCTISGEEWGQTVYELQNWAYLSLFTIPVGEVLLAIWLIALLIYLVIRFIRRQRTPQSG